MTRLLGKVSIITGAAQGMGAEHARRFVREGAYVVLTDINAQAGEALAAELGASARFVYHDVVDEDGWRTAVTVAETQFGPINVLVNNAGILGPFAKAADLSIEDYLRVCAINQTGSFLGVRHAIPSMLRAGSGSIVNISSVAGIAAVNGTPNVAYVASKFAVRGMVKQIAVEYGAHNIRANSIHPGFVRTPMVTTALDDEQIAATGRSVPIQRIAESADVANLLVFLASDEASMITGAEYAIDGGLTAT